MANFYSVDWWSVELKRMLEEQRPEDLHLDYKEKGSLLPRSRGGSGTDTQKRAEDISKDVSSFLNSDGGVLVYGVPETGDPKATGGSPIPEGPDIGFQREEIDKETIENLITSNIQPRLGPDLFQVTEVPYDGRTVFIVEVAVGVGDVWQAKDKRYYKRFQFKAEPMEHYEINMARDRNLGPDVRLIFGVNDRWEPRFSNVEFHAHRGEEVQIHIGVQNTGNGVADSALIELGLCPDTNDDALRKIYSGEFPNNVFPASFTPIGIRQVKWDNEQGNIELSVAWSQLFWNGSNPGLAGRYAPIFKTEAPLPVAVLNMKGVSLVRDATSRRMVAFCCWRIQAANMRTRKGILELRTGYGSSDSTPFIVVEEKDWEIT